jgi:DNA modification methylase
MSALPRTGQEVVHRIDSQTVVLASSEVMSEVEDQSVDLFMTSPPYWNLKTMAIPIRSEPRITRPTWTV